MTAQRDWIGFFLSSCCRALHSLSALTRSRAASSSPAASACALFHFPRRACSLPQLPPTRIHPPLTSTDSDRNRLSDAAGVTPPPSAMAAIRRSVLLAAALALVMCVAAWTTVEARLQMSE